MLNAHLSYQEPQQHEKHTIRSKSLFHAITTFHNAHNIVLFKTCITNREHAPYTHMQDLHHEQAT